LEPALKRPPYRTLKQPCEITGYSIPTITDHIKRELLRAHKEGKIWIIEVADLAEYRGVKVSDLPLIIAIYGEWVSTA
jgi:hypothetical protein